MRTSRFILVVVGLVTIHRAVDSAPVDVGSVTAAAVQLTEAEQQWLVAHPQVRWGADPDWPPFSSLDESGELIGIDADITRRVAERVGLKVTVVQASSWSEIFAKARDGEVDLLSATAKTPDRMDLF